MLSETDSKAVEEPWFTLSKEKYQTILDRALSEMEESEALPQSILSNCSELIKLLNQDDGLGPGTISRFTAPGESGKADVGNTLPAGPRKDPSSASWTPKSTLKRFSGTPKAMTETSKTNEFRKISRRCTFDLSRSKKGKKPPSLSVSQTVNKYSSSTFKTLTSRHENTEQRPSTSVRKLYVQEPIMGAQLLPNRSLAVDSLTIPRLDLKHSEFFRDLKVKKDEWSCSSLIPKSMNSLQEVTVKLESSGNDTGVDDKHLLMDLGNVAVLQTPDTRGSEFISNLRERERTREISLSDKKFQCSKLRVGVAMPTSATFQKSISKDRQSMDDGRQRLRVFPYQPRSKIKQDPEFAKLVPHWRTHQDKSPVVTYQNLCRNGSVVKQNAVLSAKRVIDECETRASNVSQTKMMLGDTKPAKLCLDGQDETSKSETWTNIPLRRKHQLWAAVDKAIVSSMMEQILGEQSNKLSLRNDEQIALEMRNNEVNQADAELDQFLSSELVDDSRDFPDERCKPHRINPTPCVYYDCERSHIRTTNDAIADVSNAKFEFEFKRSGTNHIDDVTQFKSNDVQGTTTNEIAIGNCTSALEPPLMGNFELEGNSSVGRDSVARNVHGRSDLQANTQRLGASRMSFKWKSNILLRLRKDQISEKWCLSKSLFA